MSVTENDLINEVEAYLKSFPLGKSESDVQEQFSEHSEEEVSEALDELEEDGVLLNTGGTYRWTG